jgi:hypothetical protein
VAIGRREQDTGEAHSETKDMKTATLYIPGNYEDAYLYMGWLVVVTAQRSFRFYSLDEIVAAIGKQVPASAYIAELMFRHNEWLTSAQFRSLTRTPSSTHDIAAQFDLFPKPYLQIPPEVGFHEHDVRIGTNVVLDYLIYNRQMYVGSKDGLFSAFVDWESDLPSLPSQFERKLDARCLNLTGKFGAIVASCGDDGLLWSAEGAYLGHETVRPQWERAEDKSVRARWLASGIINYKTATDPNLLEIKKTRSRERLSEDQGDSVVTAIGEERIPLQEYLLSEIRNHTPDVFDADLIQYIFNSDKIVFIYTLDRHFFALDVKGRKVGPPQVRFSHTYKGAGTRILSAATTKLGAVLETDHKVWHFANGDWTSVLDSPAISVRTFPNAKSFHNLIAITTEEGVYLVGMFDDTRRLVTM